MGNCDVCVHFENHPFVRETKDDFCNGYKKWFYELDGEDIMFCPYFKE